MSPRRIGLVGCGDFAVRVHLPNLLRRADVVIAGLAESDPLRRRTCSERVPDAPSYESYEELLGAGCVDAVVVSLPNELHARAGIVAFEQGLDVYLEKPLATSVDDGRRVVEAWQRSGRIGIIGFGYRFHPMYREARRRLQAGAIGRVVMARSIYSSAQDEMPDWKRSPRTGGGALLDLVSHEADLLRFVLGREITSVQARVRDGACEGDSTVVQVELDDGSLGQICAALLGAEEAGLEVVGERGILRLGRYGSTRVGVRGIRTRGVLGETWEQLRQLANVRYLLDKLRAPMQQPAYRFAIDNFVDVLHGRAAPEPDLADGFASLAVVAAAGESARTGHAVKPAGLQPAAVRTAS